jgi:hypothetical protein
MPDPCSERPLWQRLTGSQAIEDFSLLATEHPGVANMAATPFRLASVGQSFTGKDAVQHCQLAILGRHHRMALRNGRLGAGHSRKMPFLPRDPALNNRRAPGGSREVGTLGSARCAGKTAGPIVERDQESGLLMHFSISEAAV